MITKEVLEEVIFKMIIKSSCCISPDVFAAFETAMRQETSGASKRAMEYTFESLKD